MWALLTPRKVTAGMAIQMQVWTNEWTHIFQSEHQLHRQPIWNLELKHPTSLEKQVRLTAFFLNSLRFPTTSQQTCTRLHCRRPAAFAAHLNKLILTQLWASSSEPQLCTDTAESDINFHALYRWICFFCKALCGTLLFNIRVNKVVVTVAWQDLTHQSAAGAAR